MTINLFKKNFIPTLTSFSIPTLTDLKDKVDKDGRLDLSCQQITSLPDTIGNIQELQELHLTKNRLERLPNSISRLQNLRKLYLENNRLETLPDSIGELQNLRELRLEKNRLETLPASVGKLQKLKELHLTENRLEELPGSIGNCQRLQVLALQKNKLKNLPDSIGGLQNLEGLCIQENNLETLPSSISNCKRLKTLTLSDNRFNNLFDLIAILSKINYLSVYGFPKLSSTNKKPITNSDSAIQESEYDVVIINPTCEGGGDIELAKKIENIVSTYYRTIIISTDETSGRTNGKLEEKLKTKITANRFIITPYGIVSPSRLQEIIEWNFIINGEAKVLMIDEMDAKKQFPEKEYRKRLGFIEINNVYGTQLGFAKGSIGYLPLTQSECSAIQQRSKAELKNLMTIDDSAHYYLSYLNSNMPVTAIQVFIMNTLQELNENPSSINYICSIGDAIVKQGRNPIITLANAAYRTKENLIDLKIADKFSKMNLVIIDPDNKDVFQKELQTIGNGTIPINLVFMTTLSMPKDTWHNFIALSNSGMMTGDQSLSDYLSIKQIMPFYEMQDWKLPLRRALLEQAEEFKDSNFKEYVSTRFVGRDLGGSLYKIIEDSTMLNGTSRNDFQQFGRLIAGKTANDSCLEKIHTLMS